MAAKTGVAIDLHVLIVVQQGGLVTVVMTFGAADESCIALLNLGMAVPAGSGLIVISCLFVADCTIPGMKFL